MEPLSFIIALLIWAVSDRLKTLKRDVLRYVARYGAEKGQHRFNAYKTVDRHPTPYLQRMSHLQLHLAIR